MSNHETFRAHRCTQKEPIPRELRAQREELWGPIPPHERVLWSNALLDNPPTELTNMGKMANTQLLARDGIVMNRQWVAVARYWDDLGVSAYEWLLQKDSIVDVTPHWRETEPQDPWGECSDTERREWTTATVMFPPQFLGATIMALHNNHARKTGITNSQTWVNLALEFRAAGFTPEEFVVLNTWVGKFHKRGQKNSMITTTWGNLNKQYVRLNAQQWTHWLERYRAGEEPEQLTRDILEPHWVPED